MNVILVFTFGVSLKDWLETGLLSREIKLYEEIAENENITFTFLTFGDKSDTELIQNKSISVIPIYQYIKKSKNTYVNFIKSFGVPFLIKNKIPKSHLIKTNQLFGSWIAIILKKLLKIPLFIRTGFNPYEFKVIEKKAYKIRVFYFLLIKLSYIFCDIFTVTSNSDKKNIQNISKKSEKLFLHRNFITNLNFKKYEDRYEYKIFSVGRLIDQKNFKKLIELFSDSIFEVNIAGDGPDRVDLLNYAEKKNCNLKLLGQIENKELLKYYTNYKFFFSTSNYEGNPKALLEAMASGCIVFTTKNKNSLEIIENNKNGFFIESNSISNKVENLLQNPALAKKIIENGYETIRKNYLIEKIIEDEIRIYNSLIG
tara:strand:- start:7318 stop:8427 length:1110 start_codon:yes stop_codon:yes gene_type:complete